MSPRARVRGHRWEVQHVPVSGTEKGKYNGSTNADLDNTYYVGVFLLSYMSRDYDQEDMNFVNLANTPESLSLQQEASILIANSRKA